MLGIFGAIISDVLLYYIYKVVFMKAKVAFVYFQLVNPGYVFTNLLWMFLGIGVIIGSAGSVFAVRKFLAV
jgi:cell division transport system permease protein